VVAVGLTLVEPIADVDVKVPGVIAMVVAPAVDQYSVLLEPEAMLGGVAVKEEIVGLVAVVTATEMVVVVEPAELVAVRV
jgi:hypothetical protein